VKDPLEDGEILHSGEGGDVEQCLRLIVSNLGTNFVVFAFDCVFLSIAFHFSYL